MWNSYRVPKSGQIAKKSSTYQILIKTLMGRSWRAGMNPFSSKTLRHQAWERRLWHCESKNRSRAKGRFGHPMIISRFPWTFTHQLGGGSPAVLRHRMPNNEPLACPWGFLHPRPLFLPVPDKSIAMVFIHIGLI